ncbi:hypothetical protein [Ilumatobacter nonamiensis]|uniref:hypothetical protein n=1 Tax=Ilumatobacter nonamiensis TaxID=467093 RepID=UPI00034AEA97|nr:hypothetical protein [Ilumatobacter nonamiensis]
MTAFIVIIILLLLLGVLGAVIEGLLWLLLVAALVGAGVVLYGWWKFRSSRTT